MQFCPHDGTLLQVHVEDKGTPVARLQFFCPLCPYAVSYTHLTLPTN